MKKKPTADKKSEAAAKLGGQPESDQDARDAGVSSATAPEESKAKPAHPTRKSNPR